MYVTGPAFADMSLTIEDILAKLEKVKRNGERWIAKCPAHADGTASLQIQRGEKGILLHCFAGCEKTAIVSALGITLSDLFDKPLNGTKQEQRSSPAVKPTLVATYDYLDERGRLVYQACRLQAPDVTKECGYTKTFRQRRPNPDFDATQPEHKTDNPRWKFDMDGVTRVLYRLPHVLTAQTVWIVEGEKDADNVEKCLGIVATTNVGGAKKWLDAYSASLAGKEIVICGDTDKPGKEHVDLVFESLTGKVKSVRMIELPDKFKDVSEFIEHHGERAKAELTTLFEKAAVFHNGFRVPVYSMSEIEPDFQREVDTLKTDSLNLGCWLPTLGRLDPLIAGDLVLVIGGTGVGKTALAQNFCFAALPLTTLFFEIELTREKMFKRFVSIKTGATKKEVTAMYAEKKPLGKAVLDREFKNLFICPQSRLSTKDIERITIQSALKIGAPPKVVIVDYAQLVEGKGSSRYERASSVAEDLKIIAKSCGVILIILSQIGRPDKDEKAKARGVGLYDAKESGSLENSCALALGVWRDSQDASLLTMRVLKATEGGAGIIVKCNFDGSNMQISERMENPEAGENK